MCQILGGCGSLIPFSTPLFLPYMTQFLFGFLGEINSQKSSMTDIERNISSMQHDMTKLNILIHKNKGKQETLFQENMLRENEFMESLKVSKLRFSNLNHHIKFLVSFSFYQFFAYRRITNLSPGLIEVRRNFLVELYSGRLIFGRPFGLTDDVCMP